MQPSHLAPAEAHPSPWPSIGLGALGVLLLIPVSQHFRIDLVRCESWPPATQRFLLCALYLLCAGLLFVSWQRLLQLAQKEALSPRRALGICVLFHGALLLSPPFLSDDPLFYLAIGKVLHAPGGSLDRPLLDVLGPHDALLKLLPSHWQHGTSAYQAGFHALTWLIESIPTQSLAGKLTLYQLSSLVAVLLSAVLAADTAQRLKQPAAYGLVLVGLCPLSLLEGTLSAHNDVWLMLLSALAARLYVSRLKQRFIVLIPLALGLLIKLSALLSVATFGLSLLRRHVRPLRLLALTMLVSLTALALLRALHLEGRLVSVVLGSPDLPWDHCTRSLECLPRSILRYGFERPDLSYRVGVLFHIVGGLWLIQMGLSKEDPLTATAWGLLIYYLYLHGWAQSWYFLAIVPLRPLLPTKQGRALEVLAGSGCAYYALALYRNCLTEPWQVALCELAEGLFTIIPPTVVLLRKEPSAYVRATTSSV